MKSWFIRVSQFRDKLVDLNKTIRWQPPEIGRARFGNWLENAVDWNLSRSRFWGTPLPIWMTEDEKEIKCIGSLDELRAEVKKAVEKGVMQEELPENFDPHRPFVDEIVLVSDSGRPMYRCPEVIDVWFDSGGMPFAQWNYPFRNEKIFREQFPADFIAEGVDQTRGWFYTLHVLSTLLFDKPAFKSVIVNGLVLDKQGNKMSKRLGNVVDPMNLMEKYGADAVRWYLIGTNPPWENLRFDESQIPELLKKHFRALANTYRFFAMYANIDGFRGQEDPVPVKDRQAIDRWLLAALYRLVELVDRAYMDYELTKVARLLQEFIVEDLSNWYVRLNRRRFWKSEYNKDKVSAYQTLYTALVTVSKLMAPLSPFFSEWIYRNLREVTGEGPESVHLCDFPKPLEEWRDDELVDTMETARTIVHLALSLRKKKGIKVRQPLPRLLVFSVDRDVRKAFDLWEDVIVRETNVKAVQVVDEPVGWVKRRAEPRYALLGPRLGRLMKGVVKEIKRWGDNEISTLLKQGYITIQIDGESVKISREEVDIIHEEVSGWVSAAEGAITVALDTRVTPELKREGEARELINRIQLLRKDAGLEVTARIELFIEDEPEIRQVIQEYGDLIKQETLALDISVREGDDMPANAFVGEINVYGKQIKVGIITVEHERSAMA